jgi:apolipoprotein N-acyltransferase
MQMFGPWIWLAVGGVMVGLAMGTWTVPLAMWIAPTLLLHVVRTTTPAVGLASVWLVLYAAATIANRGVLPVSGVAYFVVNGLMATAWMLPYAADRLLALPGFTSTLVFPLAWVTVEFLSGFDASKASWGTAAYTQFGNLPLMQLTSITGITGVAFLIAWFASTVNWAWDRGFAWPAVCSGVMLYAALFTFVMLAGAVRLARTRTDAPASRIAAVTAPRSMFPPGEVTRILEGRADEGRDSLREKLTPLHDWFVERARREIKAGAGIVAWPEVGLIVLDEDEPAFLERARRLAREEHAYLLMGLAVVRLGAARPLTNKAVLVNPSGEIEFDYAKTLPVPGWEASIMNRGDGHIPVKATSLGRIAAAICYEADFPAYIRAAGRADADLLIVPANDWETIKNLHVRMALVRAIENGVSLVRATASGVSAAVDPYGRILAFTDHFSPGAETMVAWVPMRRVPTVYARVGDLFAWLCVAMLAMTIGWTSMRSLT